MLILHKPIVADDPDRVLRYERGLFEVVSPEGKTVRVTCPNGARLKPSDESSRLTNRRWWRIEKLEEC